MSETETILKRVKILFKAFIDMYEAQDKTPYVIGIQESVAVWDGEECDAFCLKEEMEYLTEDINLILDHYSEQLKEQENDE